MIRRSSFIALVFVLMSAAVLSAAAPDPLFSNVEELAREFRAGYMGYPVNQHGALKGFYDWYRSSGVEGLMFNNAGDPFNPHGRIGTLPIERRVIEHFAPLYGYEPETVWGIVTMSGTDGNDHGIYFGRKMLRHDTGLEPILYVSKESHYSNMRLADLQNMEVRLIDADPMGRMLPDALADSLDPSRPALIVYSMGTTFKGAIDDMTALDRVVDAAGCPAVYRHVDAALFGGYLPYTDRRDLVDSSKRGFDSIAISGHKFFGIDEPCGLFFMRAEILEKQDKFEIPYLNGSMPMINCSRSAVSPMKFWWIINEVGTEGFARQAEQILAMARYMKDRLDLIGWPAWLGEMSNTVFYKRPSERIMEKYMLAPDHDERFGGDLAHTVVMQHVDRAMIDRFIKDLQMEQ